MWQIGQFLGQIRELELDLPADAIEQIGNENRTLRQEHRKLTTDNQRLAERLKAARENNRFLDTPIAPRSRSPGTHTPKPIRSNLTVARRGQLWMRSWPGVESTLQVYVIRMGSPVARAQIASLSDAQIDSLLEKYEVLRFTPANGRRLGTGNMLVWGRHGLSVVYLVLDHQNMVVILRVDCFPI
ncbi:hypothetical protein [Nonomuraea zeae]|uniref:hypothetical protein n=1 Tax=Nonomuraea zeae TaxID=1642303 RepID=UPI00361B3725